MQLFLSVISCVKMIIFNSVGCETELLPRVYLRDLSYNP